jgi:hypothetical protein
MCPFSMMTSAATLSSAGKVCPAQFEISNCWHNLVYYIVYNIMYNKQYQTQYQYTILVHDIVYNI